mmetsp:Transcript_44651/g.112224  ORF Transcript_44651/g.112224 Transcript_44651/m.112224 type:complete len:281 (+) Transcript_44651:71-913(+)
MDSSTTSTSSPASIKPSWADLSEDIDSNDWDTASSLEAREDEPAWQNVYHDSRIAEPWQRYSQGHNRHRRERTGRWGWTSEQNGANAKWFSGSAPMEKMSASTVNNKICGEFPQGYSSSDSFSVVVEGLPVKLCSDACLDAILHQAGLQDAIVSYRTHQGAAEAGVAVIKLSSWLAAVRCYNHFATSSWSSSSMTVKMIYPDSQVGNTERSAQGEVNNADLEPQGVDTNLLSMESNCHDHWDVPYIEGNYSANNAYIATSHAHQMALACAYAHAQAYRRI